MVGQALIQIIVGKFTLGISNFRPLIKSVTRVNVY